MLREGLDHFWRQFGDVRSWNEPGGEVEQIEEDLVTIRDRRSQVKVP